jgi:hypothetical protein
LVDIELNFREEEEKPKVERRLVVVVVVLQVVVKDTQEIYQRIKYQ